MNYTNPFLFFVIIGSGIMFFNLLLQTVVTPNDEIRLYLSNRFHTIPILMLKVMIIREKTLFISS